MIRSAMKYLLTGSCGVLALLATSQNLSAQDDSAGGIQLKPNVSVTPQIDEGSLLQKSSYIIGYNMTSQWLNELKGQGVDFDTTSMMEGIQQAVEGEEFGMTDEEVRTIMMAFQKKVEKNQVGRMKEMADKNQAEGEAYLAENANKEGVKTLENGVQYEVIQEGAGPKPTPADTVSVHYHGTLPSGEVFDSSVNPPSGGPPTPAEFPVSGVVPGFSAALQAMPVGSKWKVTIPAELAYGMRGPGPIGPNRTLIFEIQLLGIVK